MHHLLRCTICDGETLVKGDLRVGRRDGAPSGMSPAYELGWPWALLAVVLPVLVARLMPRAGPGRGEALRFAFAEQLRALPALRRPARRGWRWWFASLGWGLLVLAAARPQTIGSPLALPLTGRDVMLAVDLSSSMQTRDLRLDDRGATRLEAVQRVTGEFVARRTGDRVGLLVFGSKPYLHTPITFDRATVRAQLDEALIGMAGSHTALGDAIGLGIKHLARETSPRRVLLLVSDGADTAGRLHALDAAEVARAHRVTIHAIGIGTELSAEQQRALGSIGLGLSLDEATLRAVAERTGGRYFRADDEDGLEAIHAEIDAIEPAARPADVVRPVRELYPWPLTGAVALALAVLLGAPIEGAVRRTGARARRRPWSISTF
jgi:Ca-activated chloride channel homolog